jgi:hypothetical protein
MAEMEMMGEPDIVLELTEAPPPARGELRLLNPKNHEMLASVPVVFIQ